MTMKHTSWNSLTTQGKTHSLRSGPEMQWNADRYASRLATLAQGFEPIGLKEMEAAALLDRTDTKFVLTSGQLQAALAALQPDYRMLAVSGQRLNHYRTLYFDTHEFDLYLLHVNGRAERYKVRSREYTDSCLSFLEVKHKTCRGRTIKERVRTSQPMTWMTPEAEDWLQNVLPYEGRALEPKLWNTFTRLTLVNRRQCERVTLDVDLSFYAGDRVTYLDRLAIAEVKLEGPGHASPFLAQMRSQRIRPKGFSKYCIGVSLLYDQVKKNSLKPKLLWLDKIMSGAM